MKILKLKDRTFCGFASLLLNEEIRPYDDDLRLQRKDNHVEMSVYLGGEMEDERKLCFNDHKCVLKTFKYQVEKYDVSYEWINYLLRCPDLTNEEKEEIVVAYNKSIEDDIERYKAKRSEALIV